MRTHVTSALYVECVLLGFCETRLFAHIMHSPCSSFVHYPVFCMHTFVCVQNTYQLTDTTKLDGRAPNTQISHLGYSTKFVFTFVCVYLCVLRDALPNVLRPNHPLKMSFCCITRRASSMMHNPQVKQIDLTHHPINTAIVCDPHGCWTTPTRDDTTRTGEKTTTNE